MNRSLTSPSALHWVAVLFALAAGVAEGAPAQEEPARPPPSTLVIGLETTHHVSGPFKEQYYDAVEFASWFPPRDAFTDFNPFFSRLATFVKDRGPILAPLNVVLLSDGITHVPGRGGEVKGENPIRRIDLSPLEFLSRSVTVRLLYASPTTAESWWRLIKRNRVRMWTQDAAVMMGWRRHFRPDLPLEKQDDLWKWVQDIVDFRVRGGAVF